MRVAILAVYLAVLSACGAEPTDGGSTTGGGSTGDSSNGGGASTAGRVIECTPGETFCVGTEVWQCTYTGRDAILDTDCMNEGSKHCVTGDACNRTTSKACCG